MLAVLVDVCPGKEKSTMCTMLLRSDCKDRPAACRCPEGATCCLDGCSGKCAKEDGSIVKSECNKAS